jgi:hypothetical protein
VIVSTIRDLRRKPGGLFHAYWQATRYNIYRRWRKGNNGQNEAAAIIVFNNSNQK